MKKKLATRSLLVTGLIVGFFELSSMNKDLPQDKDFAMPLHGFDTSYLEDKPIKHYANKKQNAASAINVFLAGKRKFILAMPSELVRDCEDPLLRTLPTQNQRQCHICERLFEELERIAVLPCGDTLCCDCANRVIFIFHKCPICSMTADGYKNSLFAK